MYIVAKNNEKRVHVTLDKHAGMKQKFDYGNWHNKGYQALYELQNPFKATKQIANIKNIELKKGDTILDYMGTEELAINLYHITQAEAMIKQGEFTKDQANTITFELGKQILEDIKKRGNTPPRDLHAHEHIKIVEKRLKEKSLAEPQIILHGISVSESILDKMKTMDINISKDLWKVALMLIFFKEDGIITMRELQEKIPNMVSFTDKQIELSPSKLSGGIKEPKFIQLIKNLNSNKKNSTNWIHAGFIECISRGKMKITNNGIELVEQWIKQLEEE